jgi:hypothetical protein
MRRPAIPVVLAASVAFAAPTISWEEAGRHVGEEVVVEGRVLGAHCSPTSCLLAFEPTFNGFTAMIPASAFRRLPPDQLDARYVGRPVHVHGTIRDVDRKPEIVVENPDDLQVVVSKAEREQQRAAASQAQVDLVERLGDVLDRLADVADRMAATQERLEAMMTSLEQQQAALAAAIPAPVPATPAPGFGAPQPRPGYEALRTLKRGMSANEVSRLAGQPLAVIPMPNGGATWDYGYGRSVSFDGRGRVVALVGFPAP